MKVKKGDIVKIITGKDKGKSGEIIVALPKTNKIVVKDVNVVTKHQKSKGEGTPSGMIKFELPIDASNVMLIDNKTGKAGRYGYKIEDGKKVRVLKGSVKAVEKKSK